MTEARTDAELAIQKLIRGTISRAWTESTACVFVLIAFAWILQTTETGSPRYYGCLLIIVGTGFIAGVVLSFTLGYKLLESHPVSDLGFWRTAFQTQVKLLRLVPIWYCAPIYSGILLFSAPVEPGVFGVFVAMALGMAALFAFIVWLNRRAASQIDRESLLFSEH